MKQCERQIFGLFSSFKPHFRVARSTDNACFFIWGCLRLYYDERKEIYRAKQGRSFFFLSKKLAIHSWVKRNINATLFITLDAFFLTCYRSVVCKMLSEICTCRTHRRAWAESTPKWQFTAYKSVTCQWSVPDFWILILYFYVNFGRCPRNRDFGVCVVTVWHLPHRSDDHRCKERRESRPEPIWVLQRNLSSHVLRAGVDVVQIISRFCRKSGLHWTHEIMDDRILKTGCFCSYFWVYRPLYVYISYLK